MAQYRLEQNLFEIEIENEEVSKEDLMRLFFDSDFTENEDYFQEDTLELGYESEAERLATEFLEKDMPAFDKMEACIEAQCESNDSYYSAYTISATRIEDTYVIALATMIRC